MNDAVVDGVGAGEDEEEVHGGARHQPRRQDRHQGGQHISSHARFRVDVPRPKISR